MMSSERKQELEKKEKKNRFMFFYTLWFFIQQFMSSFYLSLKSNIECLHLKKRKIPERTFIRQKKSFTVRFQLRDDSTEQTLKDLFEVEANNDVHYV